MSLPDDGMPGHLQASIDADHHALAVLLESLEHICAKPDAERIGCAQCAGELLAACEETLQDSTARLLQMLLAHFEREDMLMQQLPPSRALLHHCEMHRGAHADFTVRYNRLATAPGAQDVAVLVRAWRAFVHDWAREHALKYDNELFRLARHASG